MRFKNIRLTFMNLRKRKSAALSLMLLVTLATLFLCAGVSIMRDAKNMYAQNVKALGGPDNVYVMSRKVYRPEYLRFLEQDERVEAAETLPAITMGLGKFNYEGGELQLCSTFIDIEAAAGFQSLHAVERSDVPLPEDGIYLPVVLKSYNYRVGDTFTLNYKNVNYSYTVAGFFRTGGFGISNMGTLQYYLAPQAYDALASDIGEGIMISVKCRDAAQSAQLDTEFRSYIKETAQNAEGFQMHSTYNYSEAEYAFDYMGELLALAFTLFALIIVLITAFIIRFRILNNMEESMTQIGTLGALGYTGGDIRRVYAYEYSVTSLAGAAFGVLLSVVLSPKIGGIIADMVGLSWLGGAHAALNVLCGTGLVLFVLILCCIFAGKIRKYPPVVALNRGARSHSSKVNHYPLEQYKGSLQFALACKDIFHFLRQNVTVMLCMTGVTLTLLCGIIMYISFGQDLTTIRRISGWEFSDIQIQASKTADLAEMKNTIAKVEGVRKIGVSGAMTQLFAEGETVYMTPYESFEALETMSAFEGRMPLYDNEVLVTKSWAQRHGKRIGDTVSLEYNGYGASYMISGFNQSLSNNGNMIESTGEGFKRINPYGELDVLDIYLEKDYAVDTVIGKISALYGVSQESAAQGENVAALSKEEQILRAANKQIARLMNAYGVNSVDYTVSYNGKLLSGSTRQFSIESIVDFNKTFGSQLKGLVDAFAGLTLVLMISSILIITLMMTIIVRAMLSGKRTQFGVMKAMGFTTKQLMQQVALSVMPPAACGVGMGIVLNYLFADDLATMAMSSFGASQVKLSISPFVPVATGLAILLFTFLIAMLYASRTKKISVYELLTD